MHNVYAAPTLGDIKPPEGFVPGISAGAFISGLIGLIIVVAFLAAFIYLLWGGFKWITSGGNEENVSAARNQITQALIGLVIVVAAWAIIQIMQGIFGITILGKDLNSLFRSIGLGGGGGASTNCNCVGGVYTGSGCGSLLDKPC